MEDKTCKYENWQEFVDKGIIDRGTAKRTVIESWKRCRQANLDPYNTPIAGRLDKEDLLTARAQHALLLSIAKPMMEELFLTIKETGFVIILSTEKGLIIETFGDSQLLEKEEYKSILPGTDWSESIRGTNAVGTSLLTREPLQLAGFEHYCMELHGLACSCALIHDAKGNIIGALGIAGPRNNYHIHTLGMANSTAKAIELELLHKSENQQLQRLNKYILETTNHAIITVDNFGRITTFNKAAEELFKISREEVLDRIIWEVDLATELSAETEDNTSLFAKALSGETFNHIERIIRTKNGKKLTCIVDSFVLRSDNDESIGAMIILKNITEKKRIEKRLAEANRELKALVITDGLTKLYNHKYFHERLDDELHRAETYNQQLSLIMLDIDYFKHYNDNFGHPAGDKLLVEFAKIIKKSVRNKDIVARYGGEEFGIILLEADSRLAKEIAERIRESVENYPFSGREEQPKGKVTVSIGIATYPSNALSKDELIKLADEALYKAKNSAKNKVELYFSVLDDLKTDLDQSEISLINTIKTLITVINAKDKYTYGHSERVVNYSTALAQKLGFSEEQIKYIKYGAFLHDIGKIEIGRDILNKEKPLNKEEWRILQSHPLWGAEIVKPVKALKDILPQIMHHHERYDGKGYPHGLRGNEIPLSARILNLADSFDAMTTKRPYQKNMSLEEALDEVRRCSGTQFDPELAEHFIDIIRNYNFNNKENI